MKYIIQKVLSLFTPAQLRQFILLQFFVIFLALFELFGISSVAAFMSIISDKEILHKSEYLQLFYDYMSFNSLQQFYVFTGICVLLIVVVGNLIAVLATRLLINFSRDIAIYYAHQLFAYYLSRDYEYHTQVNSAVLVKNVTHEVSRVRSGILRPLMLLNGKFTVAMTILIGLVLFDPVMAFAAAALLGTSYGVIFIVVRNILHRNSILITDSNLGVLKSLNESLGGIKEIKYRNNEKKYLEDFDAYFVDQVSAESSSRVVSETPRYIIEGIVFAAIIIFTLLLLMKYEDFNRILPILSVYAVAGLKLLPALQQVFANFSSIKGNVNAFVVIADEIEEACRTKNLLPEYSEQSIRFKRKVEIKDITFSYANGVKIFDHFSITFPARKSIALVGASGSGKTTIVDILLGLLKPQHGELVVDGQIVGKSKLPQWQNNIGYISQSIYLSDSSIAQNIAFGIPEEKIEMEKVQAAAKMAQLDDFIQKMEKGYNTVVGERGVQLSGGQRQRIGIARALYHNPDIIIMDEATSALDNVTEEYVMDAINSLSGDKTIIMIAHRLSTIEDCDVIYYLENGQISDQGTYSELLSRNEKFQQLARVDR